MITKTAAIAAINATKITRGCKMIAADVINEIEESPIHIVSGCWDCPFYRYDSERTTDYCVRTCKSSEISQEHLFEQCPLKTNSLTIQLEVK